MFSLLIGLVVCGVSLLRGTAFQAALDYSVNVVWWFDLVRTLFMFLLGLLLFVIALFMASGKSKDKDADKIGPVGVYLSFAAPFYGILELFGLTLVCSSMTPVEITSIPLLVVGSIIFAVTTIIRYSVKMDTK